MNGAFMNVGTYEWKDVTVMSRGCTCTLSCLKLRKQEIGQWVKDLLTYLMRINWEFGIPYTPVSSRTFRHTYFGFGLSYKEPIHANIPNTNYKKG